MGVNGRIVTAVCSLCVASLVVSVILPGAAIEMLGIRSTALRTALLAISAASIVWRYWCARARGSDAAWVAFAFIFLFLTYRLSLRPESYNFGLDSAFYYAYLPSTFIDGDLDFENQFRSLEFDRGALRDIFEARTPTGHVPNVFPAGCAILWSPFFLLGHVIAGLLGLISLPPGPGGAFDLVHVRAVQIGQVWLSVMGLYAAYRFLSRWYGRAVSLSAVLCIWVASPLLVYATGIRLTSEAASASLAAILLLLVQRWMESRGVLTAAALGLVAGLAVAVRLQNLLLLVGLLFPLLACIRHHRLLRTGGGRAAAWAMLAGGALGFGPQLVTWRIIFGEWIPSLGHLAPNWGDPFILESLFSSRKGLFTWSPIFVLSIIGLIWVFRARRIWAIAFVMPLALNTYLNAAQPDFWAGTAFGARRFLSCTPIFAAGLAALLAAVSAMTRRRWRAIGAAALLATWSFFGLMNLRLASAFTKGTVDRYHAIRFSDVFNGDYSVHRWVVYPLQLPVQTLFSLRYGLPLYGLENEYVIGDDVFYFQEKHGNLILGLNNPLFGPGWSDDAVERTGEQVRVMESNVGLMNIPMYFLQRPGVIVEMTLTVPENEGTRRVEVLLNGQRLDVVRASAARTDLSVRLSPREYINGMNVLELQAQGDSGSPVLYLRSIRFIRTRQKTTDPAWWVGTS
ncbi:MAG: hypothetical protein HYX75_22695 [Acidobacteria bacterium]|nr:hypothetical protein [Acidobacteriota bacterium]